MVNPLPSAMSKLFTDLVGRRVSFTEQLYPAATAKRRIYCVYVIKPMESTRLICADESLLASFAGALIGLPAQTIRDRMAEPGVDEVLNDALREVMNIASRVVSVEYRAVFKNLYPNPASLPVDARKTLRDPCYASHFDVLIEDYEGGALSLLAPV